MNPSEITTLLKRTLDPSTRAEAEAGLKKGEKIIDFCPCLLQVIMDGSTEAPVRQAAAIYFKNLVGTSWSEREYDPLSGTGVPFSVHEQDRAWVRDKLVEATAQAPEALRLQLAVCVSLIVKADFPGRWPQVVDHISIHLQCPEPQRWPGTLLALYQLVKAYEYKKKEDRAPLYDAMRLLLPQIYAVASQCAKDQSQFAAEIRKLVLKIFYSLTQYTLPLELVKKDSVPSISQWMDACNAIVVREIPPLAQDGIDADERPALVWWKEKKWALHIVTRLFERYGSPGNVLPEYRHFAEDFLKKFASGILECILRLLSAHSSGTYVSPRCLQLALNYVNLAVSHSITWKMVKPHVQELMKNVVFPLMSYSEEDAELWGSDPYEYIRMKFDIFEDFVSPVTAAQTLLHSLCKKRKGELDGTMNFLLGVLQNASAPPGQRDGALHMIGTLSDILMKKKAYKNQMEDFLAQIVFEEFKSPHGHLRARACWMLHYFADVKYRNANVLTGAFDWTIQLLLHDPEAPVKVEAAIALQMLLSAHEDEAVPLVSPHIDKIAIELLNVIRATENDDLTSVMQKMLCTYSEQLAPMAADICTHLVTTFAQVVQSSDVGDDKAITAMGLLNTLQTIITVLAEESNNKKTIEPIVLQAVSYVFTVKASEFYEEALTLATDLTSTSVSPAMWKLFEEVYNVFLHEDGMDYFIDMMPLLYNYVKTDTAAFLSHPDYPRALLDMCKRMLEEDPGEDPQCNAAKLLEVAILQTRYPQMSSTLSEVTPPPPPLLLNPQQEAMAAELSAQAVQLAMKRLVRGNIATSELRVMCLQVAIAALFTDAEGFFKSVNGDPAVLSQFVEKCLDDADCFVGLHDRRICIAGMCRLMAMPEFPGVRDNAGRFLPKLVMIFEGLKRAYMQHAVDSDDGGDSDDGEGDSGAEDDSDAEVLDSDEDEIDEESNMYLETLQEKINSSAVAEQLTVKTTICQSSQDSSNSDSDLLDESGLEDYETLVDDKKSGVDEYGVFKATLEQLRQQQLPWYNELTANLSPQETAQIADVLDLCAKRKAMRESQSIEEAGGYSFQQQSVPAHFNFVGDEGSKFTFGK